MTMGLSDRYAIISVRRCICPPEREKGCRSRQSHRSILFSSASVFASNFGVTACPYCSSCKTEPCEELELRLLKDEQHLLLQLLWILRLSEKHYPAAGGAVKPCNQLADGRFAAAVCAHKADDLMLTDGKADTREGISGLLPYV